MDYQQVKDKGTPYDPIIQRTADAYGVPYALLHKQLYNESSFNPTAKSPTGPRGLAQMTGATGKAYGLETDEDFYNPEKSIDAMGRHMRDLLKSYNGDQLKAALAYNQGQGKLGSPQLAALDRGDLSAISEEGRNYMAKLADVADSPFKELVSKGITPKSQPLPFESLTGGVGKQSKVGTEVPEVQGLGFQGKDVPGVKPTFEALSVSQKGTTVEDEKSTWFGTAKAVSAEVQTGVTGMAYRAAVSDTGPALVDEVLSDAYFNTKTWSREDLDKIRDAGVKPQFYGVITGGRQEHIDDLIKLALENQKLEQDRSNAGTGAKVVAGFAGAAVDPVSYVPIPGLAGMKLVSKVGVGAAYGATTSAASEFERENVSGIKADYQSAIVGGALLGGGLSFLGDRLGAAMRKEPNGPLEGELLGPEAGPQGPDVPRLESSIDGEFGNVPYLEGGPGRLDTDNPFAGQIMRLEVRESARNTGDVDRSLMPMDAGDESGIIDGVEVGAVRGEPESVRTPDGSVYSSGNPFNPYNRAVVNDIPPGAGDRANRGVELGGFTEIGYVVNRSANDEVRAIGGDLMRSPTGMQSGSNGRYGATASDVVERLHGQDNRSYNRVHGLLEDLMNDPAYALGTGTKTAKMQQAMREVVEDLEAQGNPLGTKAKLSAKQKELQDAIKEHFTVKQDMLENPSQFGNPNATPILQGTRHAGSYFPNVYSTAIKANLIKALGSRDALKDAIKRSWLTSYASRPHVRARVDKALSDEIKANGGTVTPQSLRAAVDDYAERKAFGVSNDENLSASAFEQNMDGVAGLENNSFLESRHLFDSDMEITLPDGNTFAVNDLRDFDYAHIMPAYDRRVNGDIAIMGSTGADTAALKQRILDLGAKARTHAEKAEVAALEQAVKMLTGRARRNPDDAIQTLMRGMTDLSFFAKNAYMGLQGLGEVASLVTKGHVHMLLKGVPLLKEMTGWGSKISPQQLKDMHGLVFGKELDDLIRPTRADFVERLREQGSNEFVARTTGAFKAGTAAIVAKSPFTKFLTESTNYLMDAGRQGVMSDLVNHTFGATRKGGLFTKERLRSYSVTPQQFKEVQNLIKEHMVTGADGKVTIKDPRAFQADPRTMDLWRIGDRIADQTMLRPHKLSNQNTKAYGAGVNLMMQFKNFTIKSLNGRLIRGYMDATKNGQKVDQLLQVAISTGLAASVYVAQKHLQAISVPEAQREKFLKQSMTPGMLAYAAVTRSSHVGGPFGMANIVAAPLGLDAAAMVRSSVLPRPEPTKQQGSGAVKYNPTLSPGVQDFMSRVVDQVPAVGVAKGVYQIGKNGNGYMFNSKNNFTDTEYMTGMYNGLRNIVPNDPVTQSVLLKLFNDQGIEIK